MLLMWTSGAPWNMSNSSAMWQHFRYLLRALCLLDFPLFQPACFLMFQFFLTGSCFRIADPPVKCSALFRALVTAGTRQPEQWLWSTWLCACCQGPCLLCQGRPGLRSQASARILATCQSGAWGPLEKCICLTIHWVFVSPRNSYFQSQPLMCGIWR